mgnify:CR=1 FL=1
MGQHWVSPAVVPVVPDLVRRDPMVADLCEGTVVDHVVAEVLTDGFLVTDIRSRMSVVEGWNVRPGVVGGSQSRDPVGWDSL